MSQNQIEKSIESLVAIALRGLIVNAYWQYFRRAFVASAQSVFMGQNPKNH